MIDRVPILVLPIVFSQTQSSKTMQTKLLRWLLIIWTSPNTAIGLVLGVLALLSGGRIQLHSGCVEVSGGVVKWALQRMLGGRGAAAMTLGHSILGQTPHTLKVAREHEHVHVRQYERWGPFFLPAYLGWSAVLWLRGKDAYLDNPFEIEAYDISNPMFSAEDFEEDGEG